MRDLHNDDLSQAHWRVTGSTVETGRIPSGGGINKSARPKSKQYWALYWWIVRKVFSLLADLLATCGFVFCLGKAVYYQYYQVNIGESLYSISWAIIFLLLSLYKPKSN